jgi:hypothetical protein
MKIKKGEKRMNKRQQLTLALIFGTLVLPLASLLAQTTPPPPQTFSATIYLDYRYYLTNAGPITLKPTDPTKAYLSNQFVFRRAYFTYENKISDDLKFRFRLDADNTANVTGVTLTGSPATGVSTGKDDKLRPFVKHIYLEYSNFLVDKLVLNVGMIETLTFKPAEERWAYRSVAKTLVDGYKDITKKEIRATSADIGVSLKYPVAKYFRLAAMISNGAAYSHAENDQFKKLMLQAQFVPVAGFSVVGYYEYERQLRLASIPAETRPAGRMFKVDAFFEMVKNLILGGEWFQYKNDLYQTGGTKYNVAGWSAFGRYILSPDKLSLFARYDSYMPNSLDRANQDMTLAIVGLDWAPYHASWKLQPNVWFTNYRNPNYYSTAATSKNDVSFNLTLFMSF